MSAIDDRVAALAAFAAAVVAAAFGCTFAPALVLAILFALAAGALAGRFQQRRRRAGLGALVVASDVALVSFLVAVAIGGARCG